MRLVKKFFVVMFALLFLMQSFAFAAEERKISVTINDVPLVFWQQDPVIINGYTLVPVKEISEKLGARVNWNQQEKKVTIIKDNVAAAMVNNVNMISIYDVNGDSVTLSRNVLLDTSVTIINGKTMVPVRVVAETFGVKVEWHPRSRTVRLYTQDYSVGKPVILGE
ncbi:MAG: copper amine oxidase N-terminal domain-containing protein [Clostridia bacterium]|nr:copper amine oxidase N-terminal domain-containing protein [Clostridia bacterium]